MRILFPAFVLFLKENKKKKELKSKTEKVHNPEVNVFRFMTEYLHGEQSSESSAEKTEEKKDRFRYTPCSVSGFAFVCSIKQKGNQGHDQQKSRIEKRKPHGRLLHPDRFVNAVIRNCKVL